MNTWVIGNGEDIDGGRDVMHLADLHMYKLISIAINPLQ